MAQDKNNDDKNDVKTTNKEGYIAGTEQFVDEEITGKVLWLPTVAALVRKNFLLLKSARIQLLMALLFPTIGICLVRSFQALIEKNLESWYIFSDDSSSYKEPTIPVKHCEWFDVYHTEATDDCITILFAHYDNASIEDVNIINDLMSKVADEAGLSFGVAEEVPEDFKTSPDIFGLPSVDKMGEFLVKHYGRATSTVYFRSPLGVGVNDLELGSAVIDVRYNNSYYGSYTWEERNEVVIPGAIRRAFLDMANIKVEISARGFGVNPDSAQAQTTSSSEQTNALSDEEKQIWIDSLVTFFIIFILPFCSFITSALLGNFVASEKQQGLIGSLRINGMADSAYWFSWFVVQLVIQFAGALLAMMMVLCMNMPVASDAGFVLPLLTIFFNGVLIYSMIMLAVALAPSRPVLYMLQFLVFGIGLTSSIMSLVLPASPKDKAGKIFQAYVPGYGFGKIFSSITHYNSLNDSYDGNANTTSTAQYTFSTMFDKIGECGWKEIGEFNETAVCVMQKRFDDWMCYDYYDCDPIALNCPEDCFYYPITDFSLLIIMLAQTVCFMVLSWYIFQVIPSGNGSHRMPWFIVDPLYWGASSRSKGGELQQKSLKEQSIITRSLTKEFGTNKAIDSIDLDVQSGQVFVLLGHNGAGKTTLINLLSGKIAPTRGDAFLLGYSLNDDLHEIQRLVGSVPQHDLLWDDLSAAEHIRMFAQIRGIANSPQELEIQTTAILKKVHLEASANQQAGGFSGGMKRRLSIALAGIGGPKILFMDEPTTGIDPLNRRRIWNLVRELKKDRIVFLTTHLMQEADVLGDYVTILDHGIVQAAGTPLNLKTEHGTGYTLNMVTDVKDVNHVTEMTRNVIPSLNVVSDSAGSLAFGVPRESVDAVPDLTRKLQEKSLIREWSIAQSTLEEVFLRLASQSSNLQNRQQQISAAATEAEAMANTVGDEFAEDDLSIEADVNGNSNETKILTGFPLLQLQIGVLMRKSFLLSTRAWIGQLIQHALPVGIIFLLWYFERKMGSKSLTDEASIEIWPGASMDSYLVDQYYGRNGYWSDYLSAWVQEPCAFEWRMLADLEQPLEKLRNAERAANEIKYASDSSSSYHNLMSSLEVNIQVEPNVNASDVSAALLDGMRYFLSRTSLPETQGLADTMCGNHFNSDGNCGVCSISGWDSREFSMTRVSDSTMLFSVSGLPNSFWMETGCAISSNPCGLREIEYLLDQQEVVSHAAVYLGSAMSIKSKRTIVEVWTGKPHDLRAVGVEYDAPMSADPMSSDGYYYGDDSGARCDICYQDGAVVWVSGDGAQDFADRLNQSGEISPIAVEEDVEVIVQRNRRELGNEAVQFTASSSFDVSSCKRIEDRAYTFSYFSGSYEEQAETESSGVISNLENPTAFDQFFQVDNYMLDDICHVQNGAVAAYHERFPDAGVSLSRKVESGITTIGVTWLLNQPDDVLYDLSQQAIYSVHCQTDEVDAAGECIPGAELICVRAVPNEACGTYSSNYGRYYADFTEKTYSYLSGIIGDIPVFRDLYQDAVVSFVAAVSLTDIGLLAFIICFCLLPVVPTLTSTLVIEKHGRYVYSLVLNGMNLVSYWFSQYLYHSCQLLVMELIIVVSMNIFRLRLYEENDIQSGLMFVLFLVYNHAQFGFVTLVSNLFKRERFAAVAVGIVGIAMAGTGILIHVNTEETSRMNEWQWWWALFPTIGLFRGLVLVLWGRHYAEVWRIVLIMLASSSSYLAVGIYWHGATGVGALFKAGCSPTAVHDQEVVDSETNHAADGLEADIVEEEKRALKVLPEETAVKIAHLGKTFPTRPEPKHAVVDVSLAMDYGEIFGLLGPNGCGKTTTISMLVGLLTPTRGRAYVGGFDTVIDRKEAIRKLGIVPQFDVLYPDLTVKEHLEMFSGCKGVSFKNQYDWVLRIAKSVGLGGELFDRPCKALSGGMKRRLSIAIALLSGPKVLFLDEPTTGLDPDVKRSIWTIVEKMRSGRCMILTTHAMDEAEALCSRIGIMAQGAMKCIGTQHDLRSRYGSTYELTFTVNDEEADVESYLRKQCKSTKQVSCFGPTHVYTISKEDIELADLFEIVIDGQKQGLFSEWSMNNTSLDEVFIAITAESEGVDASEL